MSLFPDKNGFYGNFGGAWVPELLRSNTDQLASVYEDILSRTGFQSEFQRLLKEYVGRPTPLYFARGLSAKYNGRIYLKREDLCHTGAHKLNNVVGQALLAREMGKTHIVAETGAGQHGVATATVCALLQIRCTVFMGSRDMERQKLNVMRMQMLGARVIAAESGSRTLKDATNEAIRYWINHPDETHYLIGSTIGPHPYPDLVARLQSVISEEIRDQLMRNEGCNKPDMLIACVGGGSNAAGAFFHFAGNGHTLLIGAEAAGEGLDSGKTAATLTLGSEGVLHGTRTMLLQDGNGQIQEAHSVSAGLDYPGVGPVHAWLQQQAMARYIAITDREALDAAVSVSRLEGIIPALETAHAFAVLEKIDPLNGSLVVVNVSGRGDKDMETYGKYLEAEE